MRLSLLPGRRMVLAGITLACAGPAIATPAADPAPEALLVAGPPGGRLDRWAGLLAPSLGRLMPARTALDQLNVGGIDGVTGANQFEARGEPDGATALLVPGSAALSWLTGEVRARFDPARWVPLWAAVGSAVLVSRQALQPGTRLRVAAAGPAGPELPMLLALDLIGIDASPAPRDSADAVLLQGADLVAAIGIAAQSGFRPVLTLGGAPSPDAPPRRDPLLPDVPTALELVQGRAPGDMVRAVLATGTAVQLDAALMLPSLSPASSVSLWRRACMALSQDQEVVREASRLGARLLPATAAAYCTRTIASDPAALLGLRRWLTARHDWQPG